MYELIKSGMVDAQKVSERTTLVEATSLLRYQAFGRKAGRPFGPSMAMGILWMLSGAEAFWLSYHQKRRATQALEEVSAEGLAAKCRRRAQVVCLRIDDSFVDEAMSMVRPSGLSALDFYDFDLVLSKNIHEGYIDAVELSRLRARCFAESDSRGNFILHVAEGSCLKEMSPMPEAVVALDLAESLDIRTRRAGLERLEGLIDGRKNGLYR
ncbi:hypothetical protein [uncultured Adlercreutzia sp.]|uniref:hypothetical protein n=1 Tax=uncultured Adlercreutzia sp. TaxID=875803 RepID=UPI00267627CD|nr:hypothetical protein [uncultured Adlercreutzia sp.]